METSTIASQRETELALLGFLKKYNPDVYALWRLHPDYDGDESSDDSEAEQWEDVAAAETSADAATDENPLTFYRRKHMDYLLDAKLANIPSNSQGLYPAQPWLAYWSLQAADVLGITPQLLARVRKDALVAKLLSCLSSVGQEDEARARAALAADASDPTHGAQPAPPSRSASAFPQPSPVDMRRPCISFSGGACEQMPHMATSYAACCALAILTGHEAPPLRGTSDRPLSADSVSPALLRTLPRAAIKRWLLSVRNVDGSFRMHWGGESDVRASYCAAVVTRLLRLDEPDTFSSEADEDDEDSRHSSADVRATPVLTAQTARFVASSQTHEGGFACGAYASEAHGAYTQCSLASLLLMHSSHLCDLARLRRWLAVRQLAYEGGFNGRTNKLVDSCYCHWVGASHVLLRVAEAHSKALGHGHAQVLRGEPEVPLTAKEVCLLHHAQLLDARGIACQDDAAWDREETRVFTEADTTDFFLDTDDRVKRVSLNKVRAREQFYQRAAPVSETEADPADEAKKADKAFYAAEVGDFYFNQRKLQLYVLACCQSKTKGGLMDKPGVAHDTYHTCYSLSGMSQSQNLHYAPLLSALDHPVSDEKVSPASLNTSYLTRAVEKGYVPRSKTKAQELADPAAAGSYGVVLGICGATTAADISMLRVTNPIFNLHPHRVLSALSAFGPKTFV